MRIGAGKAERADPGIQALAVVLSQIVGVDCGLAAAVLQLQFRVQPRKLGIGRQQPVLQGEAGFDDTANASGGFQMAQIALDCAQQTRRAAAIVQHRLQCRDFNRIAQRGAGAMRFHKADLRR